MRTLCCYYQGEGTLDKHPGLMLGLGAQASPPGPILGLLGRRQRCRPASGCAVICAQLHTRACGSSLQRCALLLQGFAPAKAAANDAAAAAKKKAADEEAAGEDDSKFDDFMVTGEPFAACRCLRQSTRCPALLGCCSLQGNDAGAFASAAGEYDQDDKEADVVRLALRCFGCSPLGTRG